MSAGDQLFGVLELFGLRRVMRHAAVNHVARAVMVRCTVCLISRGFLAAVVANPVLEEFREWIGSHVTGRRSGSTRLRPASRRPSGGSLSLSEARRVETEECCDQDCRQNPQCGANHAHRPTFARRNRGQRQSHRDSQVCFKYNARKRYGHQARSDFHLLQAKSDGLGATFDA